MLRAIDRAVTMTFTQFKQHMVSKDMRCMDYFVKYDGFHLVAITNAYGSVEYFTKWDTPLATGTTHASMRRGSRTLRAINTYLQSLEDRVSPCNIEVQGVRGTARQVNFEFIAMRRDLATDMEEEWMEGKAESLQDLFQGKCVNADGTLNTVDYEYRVRIFDVYFKSDVPTFAKVEAAAEAYGQDMAATQIFSFKELVHFLNGCEGVVAHGQGKAEVFKIKVPCPVRARILGVKCTLQDFAGWDKLLVCVENTHDNCMEAVYEIDWTEILTDFTRPSKGKVYANPRCVKHSPAAGTVVYELAKGKISNSAIAPTLNALYGQIGKMIRFPPIATTATEASIRVTSTIPSIVRCAGNRSFNLTGYEYLTTPVDVIMGVNDVWEIDNNQLHLQAASVLCVPGAGFGPAEFMGMPFTAKHTLHTAAAQRLCRDRVEYYKLVGVPHDPFHDLEPMDAKLFCSEM